MVAAALFPTSLGRRPNHREMRANVGGRNSAWHHLGVAACRVRRKKRAFLPIRYRDRGGRSGCTTLEIGLMCLFIAKSGRTVESPKAMGWTPPLVTASMCQSGIADQPLEPRGASAMKITTIGIDLAKNVFQVHGVDERGRAVLKKRLKRDQMAGFFAKLPACLIGMEACGSSHHWARKLQGFGHTVRLMAPQFIKPYVKTNKNDVADAEAVCEAVARPNMRFVPVKSVEQQAVLSLHRVRQSFVKARTAQANQIRSLLGEFGLVMPKGITNVRKRVPEVLENATDKLPAAFPHLVGRLLDHFKELDRQVGELEAQIKAWHRSSELSQRLEKIPGIGPLGPSPRVASIADPRSFDNGRQVSAGTGPA